MYILYIELYRHVWTYTCIYLYVGNNWAQVLHLGEQCVRWEKTAAASRDRHGSVTFRMFLLWCSSWAAPGCIDGVPRPKCQTFWGVRSCRMSDRAAIWLWQQFTTVKVRATLTTTTKSTTFEEIRCLGLVPQLGLLPSWIPTVKSVLKDVASTSCLHIKDGEKGCMVHDGPSRMAWTFFLFFSLARNDARLENFKLWILLRLNVVIKSQAIASWSHASSAWNFRGRALLKRWPSLR